MRLCPLVGHRFPTSHFFVCLKIIIAESASVASKSAGPSVLETTYQQLIDAQISAYPQQDLLRVTFDKYHWSYSKFRVR